MCFPTTLRATGGLAVALFLHGTMLIKDGDLIRCFLTSASPRSPSTPLPQTPPSPGACGTGAAANRMRLSVKMRFWLQALGLITCLAASGPWSDITSRNNKHLPTTYGGMRRTCTRKQMTTATEAESGGRNRLDPGSILLPAPAGRALKHCHT